MNGMDCHGMAMEGARKRVPVPRFSLQTVRQCEWVHLDGQTPKLQMRIFELGGGREQTR